MAVAALRPVDPAFESWWVRPGSATVVELHGDDRISVIDPEGGQPAEITVLAPNGREDPGALGISADAPASVLRTGGDDGFLAALHARGLRPHDAKALRLFDHDGAPGAPRWSWGPPGGAAWGAAPRRPRRWWSRSAAPRRGRAPRSSSRPRWP